jgi:hypothetical protein
MSGDRPVAKDDQAPAPPAYELALRRQTVRGSWIYLPEEIARQHPLYGIGGWTGVLLALLIAHAGFAVWAVVTELGPKGLATMIIIPLFAIVLLPVLALAGLVIACPILVLKRSPAFPACFIIAAALAIAFSIISLFGSLDEPSSRILVAGFATYLVLNLGALLYVFFSARVNVTFRKRVRRSDPWVKAEGSSGGG